MKAQSPSDLEVGRVLKDPWCPESGRQDSHTKAAVPTIVEARFALIVYTQQAVAALVGSASRRSRD
jgi:glutamate formiminotransferase